MADGLSVFLVEDEALIRMMIADMVEELGHHVVAQADNVRAALLLVSRGEAPLGIVYATDAHAEKGVEVVGTFPEDSHPPIIYPVAQTADSKDKDTPAFLKCLRSVKAGALFKEQGFTVLAPSN